MTQTETVSADLPRFPAGIQTASAQRRFKTLRAITALVLREMSTTYGRSPGGYIWAVVEPVAGIALLSFVFSLGFRSPPMGTNFPIFYATGMLPFVMYSDLGSKIAQAILFSRQLLAYPSVTFFDAIAARVIVNLITQVMVAYIVFTGILLLFDTKTTPDLPRIVLSLAMAASVGIGVGTLNCVLMTMFPAWQRVFGIITRPLFIISCIFFLYETIPEPYRGFLWFNPLVHAVGEMRAAFYPAYRADYVSATYVFGFSLVLTALGLVLLVRYHRDLANN